ncbi:MAG: NPCBM/NEW2 domain-containing protein [Gemmataceae bacterium]
MIPLALSLLLAADAPPFVVRADSGKEFTGPVVRLAAWELRHGKGDGRRLAAGEWHSLRRADLPLPELPTDEHLVLANGDRVPVTGLRLDDEKLSFRHEALDGGKETSVPLSAAALIWRLPPQGVVSGEKLRHRLLRAKRSRDVVLLRNGDTVEGTLQTIKAGQVVVEINKKAVPLLWEQLSAVALSTELLDRTPPKGKRARLALTGSGGRITLVSASSDGETITGKTAFGASLRLPLDKVAGLDAVGEGVAYLSDLTPAKYEYSPYLDEKWPLANDCTATGGDLRVGGATYDRGLGLHANSRVVYSLGESPRAFEALVGLDDRDGRQGRVKVRVLLDGKPADLGRREVLTHDAGPLAVRLDVAGAKELTLEVLPADHGPVQAVVNWANARLLK